MTFRYLTSGESHGACSNAILEGIPAGFTVDLDFINNELARRQIGYGRGARMKIESDKIQIKSGIRFGKTTGAPICLEIENKDWKNWLIPMSVEKVDLKNPEILKLVEEKKISKVRPGHADLTGALKYNHEDVRNILERSSARETAIRVAIGGVAQNILKNFGMKIFSHVVQIGSVKISDEVYKNSFDEIEKSAESNDLRCADKNAYLKMKEEIDVCEQKGDTLGGIIEIIVQNAPVGLGSFVHWDRKIDGLLAQAIMSIPAIKSVHFGIGDKVAELSGSNVHDEIFEKEKKWFHVLQKNGTYIRKTNNSGGIEGGMTNGEAIVIRCAMKPIPTMKTPLNSIDLKTQKEHVAHFERSDVCAVPACGIVAEAMSANVLLKEFLEKFGGDSFYEISANYSNYKNMYLKR